MKDFIKVQQKLLKRKKTKLGINMKIIIITNNKMINKSMKLVQQMMKMNYLKEKALDMVMRGWSQQRMKTIQTLIIKKILVKLIMMRELLNYIGEAVNLKKLDINQNRLMSQCNFL